MKPKTILINPDELKEYIEEAVRQEFKNIPEIRNYIYSEVDKLVSKYITQLIKEEAVKKCEEEINQTIVELKESIKGLFWKVKGYPRKETQNYGIIEDAIEFGIDSMRRDGIKK